MIENIYSEFNRVVSVFQLGNILKNPASEIEDVSVNTGEVFTSATVAPGDNSGQNRLVVNNADKRSTRVT